MYKQISANKRSSFWLTLLFVSFILFLGWLFGKTQGWGYSGLVFALLVALSLALIGYFQSDKIVLAVSKAKPVDKRENPYLANLIEGLAIAAGIPAPKVYIIQDSAPNAFATGRSPQNASIAVTTGLLDKLDRLELEGVIAHEIAHVKNYDIRYATLVVVFVGTVVLISDWMGRGFFYGRRRKVSIKGGQVVVLIALLLAILSPLIAKLIQLAISRQREYLADANGALLTRYPEGLASALEKITKDTEPLEAANKATAHLFIINPLLEHRNRLNDLFLTHPPIDERVRRLRSM